MRGSNLWENKGSVLKASMRITCHLLRHEKHVSSQRYTTTMLVSKEYEEASFFTGTTQNNTNTYDTDVHTHTNTQRTKYYARAQSHGRSWEVGGGRPLLALSALSGRTAAVAAWRCSGRKPCSQGRGSLEGFCSPVWRRQRSVLCERTGGCSALSWRQ